MCSCACTPCELHLMHSGSGLAVLCHRHPAAPAGSSESLSLQSCSSGPQPADPAWLSLFAWWKGRAQQLSWVACLGCFVLVEQERQAMIGVEGHSAGASGEISLAASWQPALHGAQCRLHQASLISAVPLTCSTAAAQFASWPGTCSLLLIAAPVSQSACTPATAPIPPRCPVVVPCGLQGFTAGLHMLRPVQAATGGTRAIAVARAELPASVPASSEVGGRMGSVQHKRTASQVGLWCSCRAGQSSCRGPHPFRRRGGASVRHQQGRRPLQRPQGHCGWCNRRSGQCHRAAPLRRGCAGLAPCCHSRLSLYHTAQQPAVSTSAVLCRRGSPRAAS